ncbi:MAG: hypothetical protein HY290_14215 [Planctomycetia bacterium]|nr:hypothetical protein [Planctomycetia bacterium]
MKTTIGDVHVSRGEPPHGNPYLDTSKNMEIDDRPNALRMFRDTGEMGQYTFGHAPACGGARRITSRDEIDWEGMR